MSEELRGYPGGWKLEDALKEHAFSLELAYWMQNVLEDCQLIFDYGAGPAFYSRYLSDRGYIVYAFDANPLRELLLYPVYMLDLSKRAENNRKADATLCLEVGEHIPEEYESIVLDNIANSAEKKIIMSWAIPGQGGFGHVNCKPNEYIIAQMQLRGWKHNPEQSDFLRARCSGCSWFENTIMVFDK